jgi:hypothetical protein
MGAHANACVVAASREWSLALRLALRPLPGEHSQTHVTNLHGRSG